MCETSDGKKRCRFVTANCEATSQLPSGNSSQLLISSSAPVSAGESSPNLPNLSDFPHASDAIFTWGSMDSKVSVMLWKQPIKKLFIGEVTVLKFLMEMLSKSL